MSTAERNVPLEGASVEKITCGHVGCKERVERSHWYCCGDQIATDAGRAEGDPYCGRYFCSLHLTFIRVYRDIVKYGKYLQVCNDCHDRQKCPRCVGHRKVDGERCEMCDGWGHTAVKKGMAV